MNKNISNNPVSIRKAHREDLPEMIILFQETITAVCKEDYNTHQLKAWASGAENKKRWLNVMKEQYILVAESENKMVGFCTLNNGSYIDLFFVHKEYQRQGIASRLYSLIEKEALQQQKKFLTADVSKTARPFFERMNFQIIREQNVNIKGVDLTNYTMKKELIT